MYEITRWYYFDDNYLYDIINDEPKVLLIGQWAEEITAVTQVALEYINTNEILGRTWKIIKRENGYLKSDVFQGREYIFDIKAESMQDGIVRSFRIQLLHPFNHQNEVEVVSYVQNIQKPVHIIVPLTGVLNNAKNIMLVFQQTAKLKEGLCLTLVLFKKRGIYQQLFDPNIWEYLENFKQNNKEMCFHMREINSDYNFFDGIKQSIEEIEENNIILTLKDDIEFNSDAIENCQNLALQNIRVYFPLSFSQFNPKNIEDGMPFGKPKNVDKKSFTKFTGYWMHNMHDFICAYSDDLKSILSKTESLVYEENPNNIFIEQSENGDNVYNKFLLANYKVISSVEPGLLRLYNNINCTNIRNKLDRRKCKIQMMETSGSKQELNILYLNENASKLR
uniref:Hexosyltransferase n=1 Tax=Molgula tectiformis TaxID=30286 RepID=A0A9R3_MOLTE|nr:noto6 [Molgula tectiformis]